MKTDVPLGFVLVCALAACEGSAGLTGAKGEPCYAGLTDQNGDDVVDILDCAGAAGEGYFPLEPSGVVGMVTNAAGEPVTGGVVYFVPAADVAALPATTIAVDSDNDEPLEDLIAANSAIYQQAAVGISSAGRYALATLDDGTYFITFVPAVDDTTVLPGGSACRLATSSAVLIGTRLDLVVSSMSPADAQFVGSGACVSCHGRTHISETMHRIGIWSGYESGRLQNFEPRLTELYMAINNKFEAASGAGTTVYFYDYDATRGFDKYKTMETDPGTNVAFTVTVRRDSGDDDDLEMVLHNVQNAADPDRTYRVDLIYGGGVNKQRYMTRLTNASGGFHAMLPLQFQTAGSDAELYGRTSKIWRDYHGDYWYDETTDTFKEPGNSKSFEKNCISCHAVGSRLTGSDATVWSANLVEDHIFNSGDVDLDSDGFAEELNVGCETCHGPGSRHWDAAGQGKHIVSPSLLTPEREAMICGQCHSRPKGALGTDNPVNTDGWMMRAGTSRNEFLTSYATTQLDGAANDYYADDDKHSKSHHQQYSDFIRSGLYKNATQLVTCPTCHDPHKRTEYGRQLRENPADNAAICGSCHASLTDDMAAHITTVYGAAVATKADLSTTKCADCHMPKTAKTGAGQPGLILAGVQYWMNDVTSHMFKVPDRALATSQAMPVPYTNVCGSCHTAAP